MANSYIFSLTDSRWINGTTSYDGIGLSVISTNSHANSNLLRLTYNSDVNFRVRQDGTIFANGSLSINKDILASGNVVANNLTGSIVISNTVAPSTASATGKAGEIRWDNSYVYVCIANNSWKRANLATW